MIKILNLSPLKDIASRSLTDHRVNVFSRFSRDEFEVYSFLTNRNFVKGAIRPLAEKRNPFLFLIYGLRQMVAIRPDILLGTGSPYDVVFYLFRPRKAKYVLAWHGPFDRAWLLDINNYSFISRVSWYGQKFLMRHAATVICDSQYIKDSVLKAMPEKKVFVVGNGVNSALFGPEKRERKWLNEFAGITSTHPIIVFVAHLIRRKRPEILAALARKMPDVEFVIVGPEGYYHREDIAAWQKEAPNFHWRERVSREFLPKLLASSDIFVYPTLNEPFGVITIESMASGLPVILTRSGAAEEIVRDGVDGFLIDEGPGEVEKIAGKVRELLADDKERRAMGAKARERTIKTFHWESVSGKYREAILAARA